MLAVIKPFQKDVEFYPCKKNFLKEIFRWNDDQNKLEEITAWNGDFFKISINGSHTVLSPGSEHIIFKDLDSGIINFLEIKDFYERYRELNIKKYQD